MRLRVVDMFAGWGGFSLGAQLAGCEVVYAANHWPLAVQVHRRNHPLTHHECQDLQQADFTRLPEYDVLIASPACQGNSRASQPRRRRYHDELRSTAWAVVECADVTEPRAIIVENTIDLRRWRLYESWCAALRALGYHVAEHLVQASTLGVPQRRLRLFVTATRVALPALDLPVFEEVPFSSCIDDLAAGWRLVRSAPRPVQDRISLGRLRCGRRFLSQHTTDHKGTPLHEPIRTITTKNQWNLVDGDSYRSLTARELARGMAFPDAYSWPDEVDKNTALVGIGNAVPPLVGEHVIRAVAATILDTPFTPGDHPDRVVVPTSR